MRGKFFDLVTTSKSSIEIQKAITLTSSQIISKIFEEVIFI